MIKVSKRTVTPLDQIPIIEVSEKIRMSHSVKVESEQIGGNSWNFWSLHSHFENEVVLARSPFVNTEICRGPDNYWPQNPWELGRDGDEDNCEGEGEEEEDKDDDCDEEEGMELWLKV